MSALENIVEAISPFGYPYAPDIYEGRSDHYFAYNYANIRAGLRGDDETMEAVASVQVHFFLPRKEKFTDIKKRVSKALERQGFTWPEVTMLIEGNMRHIVFECEIDEEVEEQTWPI